MLLVDRARLQHAMRVPSVVYVYVDRFILEGCILSSMLKGTLLSSTLSLLPLLDTSETAKLPT